MFYLTTHSTHFIYGYMASDIWLRTILIVRKETRCRHIGYSFRLTARVLLYAPSHRIAHTTDFVTPEIAQWVHPMKDRSDDPSHHERTLLPRSYILLPNLFRRERYQSETSLELNSRSSQCSTTGVTKAVVCVILSVGWCI